MSNTKKSTSTIVDTATRVEQPPGGEGQFSACLVVIQGPEVGRQFLLDGKQHTLGRSSGASIRLSAPGISRLHCRIDRDDRGYRVEDLESTNRTRINEQVISSHELADQDRIRLGQTVLKFVGPDNPEAAYHKKVHEVSGQDRRTGLFSRRQILTDLAVAAESASASPEETGGGLLYVVLDGPTKWRDRIGMTGIDRLMESIGQRIFATLEDSHLVARFAEHSLVVLVKDVDAEALFDLGQQLRTAVGSEIFELDKRELAVTVSAGVCPFTLRITDADTMLVCAARAADQAQAAGGNRCQRYQARVSAARANDDDRDLLSLLREAVRKGTLQTLFQPAVSVTDDSVTHYQLLPRLLTDDDQLIPAARFVPVAEHHGEIAPVDRWMSVRALTVIREQLGQDNPMRIFISQSPASLADDARYESLGQGLEPPIANQRLLVFEFSQTAVMDDLKQARKLFPRLRELGFAVAISGVQREPGPAQIFGHLEIDYIKIHPEFARSISRDDVAAGMFEMMVEQIHEAGTRIIVPHVEDAETMGRLWSLGVDLLQGNFIQKPTQTPDFSLGSH